jgi:SAM-dependent methyltransferase
MHYKIMLDYLFPTSRKLLVNASVNRINFDFCNDVLIVGSGADPYRKFFSKTCRYVTLDIVPNKDVQLVADAHELPVQKESFDCILATEVLEHLHDPHLFIDAAYVALKPEGMLVFTVPFMFHQHADPNDYWRPTKQTIYNLCSSFSLCKIQSQGNRLHVLSDLITTAFYPYPVFYPLRIINHLLLFLGGTFQKTTAPSGYLVVANK